MLSGEVDEAETHSSPSEMLIMNDKRETVLTI